MFMHDTIYAVLVFAFQLFLIMDPVAAMPVFMSITKSNTHSERMQMARTSAQVATAVLIIFAVFGTMILNYFQVSLSAVKIGGGILLAIIGMEMIYGRNTGSEINEADQHLASKMEDISITPLAFPLLAGPGSITTVLLFTENLISPLSYMIALAAILIVGVSAYYTIIQSDKITKVLGELGTKVVIRLMGLIVLFIAIQSVLEGWASFF